jgi:hypothetical protein
VIADRFCGRRQHGRRHGVARARARRRRPQIVDERDDSFALIARHESPKSQKDLHAALELARRLGIELPLTAVSHDLLPAVWGVDG